MAEERFELALQFPPPSRSDGGGGDPGFKPGETEGASWSSKKTCHSRASGNLAPAILRNDALALVCTFQLYAPGSPLARG